MTADSISQAITLTGQTLKSLAKIALLSRPWARPASLSPKCSGQGTPSPQPLIIMGNGPALGANLEHDLDLLVSHPTLAVNFAANTPAFAQVKPRHYLLMDPHFFKLPSPDANVGRLYDNLALVDWPMTLLVPASVHSLPPSIASHPSVTLQRFNPVGIEGPRWLTHRAFDAALAMPRPRNVLIPAIMCGIWLGYKRIALCGADHSWLRTLEVAPDNTVVSVQPHFYTDGPDEHRRVATMFRDTRLHQLLWGFQLAFRGYHSIAPWAATRGIEIVNCTPGSYIDAFPRSTLREFCSV